MAQVEFFSKGKAEERNEDFYGFNDSAFVVADGATDKSGRMYEGKTGGEIVSRLVVETCLSSGLFGVTLVQSINSALKNIYSNFGILEETRKDKKYRFTCGFVSVLDGEDEWVITSLGDSGFRINGEETHMEVFQVDVANSEARSKYIRETGDIEGSRAHILPLLIREFEYQNNPDHLLGYGFIDGEKTPEKFVQVFRYPKSFIKTLELFTGGYFDVPKEVSLKAWEETYDRVEREDPHKYLKYKSTKSKDDRTIMIVRF